MRLYIIEFIMYIVHFYKDVNIYSLLNKLRIHNTRIYSRFREIQY